MFAASLFAEFARTPASLPATTRKAVIRTVFDLLTAAIAGYPTQGAQAARTAAAQSWGAGPAACWFSDTQLAIAGAAFANSAAASMLDLDDGHRAAAGHPGASVIPAVLAHAQTHATGIEQLLTAIAIGYEIGIRISAARDFKTLGTMATGLWCGQGVAAAIGYLRGLPADRIAHAIAIAGTTAPCLTPVAYTEFMGNTVKEGIPAATATGILAVDLAQAGYTGPVDLLEHATFDRTVLTRDLGSNWMIESVYFKEYSCCRWAHAPIDAILMLQERHGLAADDIETIAIDTFGRALTLNNEAAPHSLESAQYSLPFCVALAATRGAQAMLPMLQEALNDKETLTLSKRVTLHLDPKFDAMFSASVPGRVTVTARGAQHSETVLAPKGEPTNPMSWQDLERKFFAATRKAADPHWAGRIVAAVRRFEAGETEPLFTALRQNIVRANAPAQ